MVKIKTEDGEIFEFSDIYRETIEYIQKNRYCKKILCEDCPFCIDNSGVEIDEKLCFCCQGQDYKTIDNNPDLSDDIEANELIEKLEMDEYKVFIDAMNAHKLSEAQKDLYKSSKDEIDAIITEDEHKRFKAYLKNNFSMLVKTHPNNMIKEITVKIGDELIERVTI